MENQKVCKKLKIVIRQMEKEKQNRFVKVRTMLALKKILI